MTTDLKLTSLQYSNISMSTPSRFEYSSQLAKPRSLLCQLCRVRGPVQFGSQEVPPVSLDPRHDDLLVSLGPRFVRTQRPAAFVCFWS